jgi:hypothetical protein
VRFELSPRSGEFVPSRRAVSIELVGAEVVEVEETTAAVVIERQLTTD